MKKFLFALVCLLWLSNGYAQKNNSLLWQISGNGLKSPSYLFGTYHLAGKSFIDSLPEIGKRFSTCKVVVGEMVIDSTMAMQLMPHMVAPETEALDKIFTPDEYKLITDYAQEVLQLKAAMINYLKPSALGMMLTVATAPKTYTQSNPAMDVYFQEEAKRRNEMVIGLETLDQQAKWLLDQPLEIQKKELLATVKEGKNLTKNTLEGYKIYSRQDLDGLKAILEKEDDLLSDHDEKLLKDRNLNWMTQLPSIMKAQPAFIAVGAAHLIGKWGLINQLRLKGYKVTPVKM